MKAVVVGLVTILGGIAPLRAEQTRVTVVPFQLMASKHIAILVTINGKGPFRMIFDTGAPVTLINTKVARISGVLPHDFKASPLAMFGAAGQFTIDTLEVG